MKRLFWLTAVPLFFLLFSCYNGVDWFSGTETSSGFKPFGVGTQPGTLLVIEKNKSIELNWIRDQLTDTLSGTDHYEIWMSTSDDRAKASLIDKTSEKYYDATSLENGQRYYFWIRGVNEQGKSSFSDAVSGTPNDYTVSYCCGSGTYFLEPDDMVSYPVTDDFMTVGETLTDKKAYPAGSSVAVADIADYMRGTEIRDGIHQRFVSWNTARDGSGTEYKAASQVVLNSNLELYAIYTTDDSVLRKVGPEWGLIFYDAGSEQSWGRYLEAAPVFSEFRGKMWGVVDVPGTSGTIGSGAANTAAIVSVLNDKGVSGFAAQLCDEMGGELKWFLPSKDELAELIWVLHGVKFEGSVIYNPDVQQGGIGGLSSASYWSSSLDDAGKAWCQELTEGAADYGAQYSADLSGSRNVRAVRAF